MGGCGSQVTRPYCTRNVREAKVELKEKVKCLAKTRSVQEEYKSEITELKAEMDASPLGKRLKQVYQYLEVAKEDVASAEVKVREAAMDAYQNTDNKKPHGAVQVKMHTTVVYEQDAAFDYARNHLPQALTFNRRKFELAAKVLDLDFVTVLKEPRVSIARDLSSYLNDNDDDL
jgi:hypothetical protein